MNARSWGVNQAASGSCGIAPDCALLSSCLGPFEGISSTVSLQPSDHRADTPIVRAASGRSTWILTAFLCAACNSVTTPTADGSAPAGREMPTLDVSEGADGANAATDAVARIDAGVDASMRADAINVDAPDGVVAPPDPCDPKVVIDLDRAGIFTRDAVYFYGTTVGTQEDLGNGPRPACFSWPQHPRFFRWTTRRRAALLLGVVPSYGAPDMVVWTATGCAPDADANGCSRTPRGAFETEVLDVGTTVWIGVASIPARDVRQQSTVGEFMLWMTEVRPPALGEACSRSVEGRACPAGAHCAENERCARDGAVGGLCLDGTSCDPGLECSDYGYCERLAAEGELCASGGRTCVAGTRCVRVDAMDARCLRERSEGGACAPAPGLPGLCGPGLVCNVEAVRSRGYAPLGITDVADVARCRPAVGEGEVCGARLRRPCGPGLSCVVDGSVGRCVRDGTPGGLALGDPCYQGGCREGLLCEASHCVSPAGAGAPCDRDVDCEPGLFCAKPLGRLGACTARPSPRERCNAFDGSPACVDGWRCGPNGTSSPCEGWGGIGQRCLGSWPQCEEGLLCNGESCVAAPLGAGASGGRCRDDAAARCDAGLVCDPTRFVCGRSLPLGAPCNVTYPGDGVCEPGADCAPSGRCEIVGSALGPCGGPCLAPGDVDGPCASGATPCRAGLRCVAPADGSARHPFCTMPVGEGEWWCSEDICADGYACSWQGDHCARVGTVGVICDVNSPTDACGSSLVCVDRYCIPPTHPGGACVFVDRSSLCSSGQICVAGVCVESGAEGTSCDPSAPCNPGLFCGDSVCRRSATSGPCPQSGSATFSEAGVTCGPGAGCLMTPCGPYDGCSTSFEYRSTCTPRGVAAGPCRDLVPWCDAGLACSNGVCVSGSMVGLP